MKMMNFTEVGRRLGQLGIVLGATLATRMAMAGISPAIAARVLGHASPVTTMMYYTRVLEADAAAAVARTWVL